jgi:outer membrane protein TolC
MSEIAASPTKEKKKSIISSGMELNHKNGKVMKHYFSIILVFLIYAGVFSQNNPAPLSLSDAVRLGKASNLSLQQQLERIQQARANLDVQKAGYFPTLTANGLFNYVSNIPELNLPLGPGAAGADEVKIYDFNLQLQQPLFTGFRLRHQVKAAGEELLYSESQLQEIKNQIIFQITQIYYAAQLNLMQQKVYRTSLERTGYTLELTKNMFEAGQMRAIDTLSVSNQLLHITTALNKLQHEYAVILTQLELILNSEGIRGVQSFSGKDLAVELAELVKYQEQALQNRPELGQLQHKIQSQNFMRKSVQSSYYPQIYASATFHYLYPDVEILKKEWTDLYLVGLNLKWELWNRGRRKNQTRQLSAAISILTTQQEKEIKTIKNEVKQAYQNLLSDRDQIHLSRKMANQERERYRITRNQYEQGLATTMDLKDAEEALTATELEVQLNYIKWQQDNARMDYVTGIIEKKFLE